MLFRRIRVNPCPSLLGALLGVCSSSGVELSADGFKPMPVVRIQTAILICAAAALIAAPGGSVAAPSSAPFPVQFEPFVSLYDPARGGLPESQGRLRYAALPPPVDARTTFDGSGTVLTTTTDLAELAGWSIDPARAPALDRHVGFTLRFALQIIEERRLPSDDNGDGLDDRAGWSVTLLASDRRGIELGFWHDRVWAQEGGVEPDLFTQAEGAAINAAQFAVYALTIRGDRYTLDRDGVTVLSGALRDYTAFSGSIDPYETPNFVFLGDNTSRAGVRARLGAVAIDIGARVMLPLVVTPASPGAAFTETAASVVQRRSRAGTRRSWFRHRRSGCSPGQASAHRQQDVRPVHC